MDEEKDRLKAAPNSLVFVSLASMYLDNGMIDEAIDLCKSGLSIEPNSEEAHFILAKAVYEKGNKEGSKKILLGILSMNPENKSAKELLDSIVSTEELSKKREEIKEEEKIEEEREKVGEKTEIEKKEERGTSDKRAIMLGQEEIVSEQGEKQGMEESDISQQASTEKEIFEKQTEIEEKPEMVQEVDEEEVKGLLDKIEKIEKIEGVINCFFRLSNGKIVQPPELVGNIDDLLPLLDALLEAVESAAGSLKMGKVNFISLEIKKGIFYISKHKEYDCFLFSRTADNFGLVKAFLPKILYGSSEQKG
jgi:tetratricopeptide (TPR) repeat protein